MADNKPNVRIGFIGLGTMGMPMALNLLNVGHDLGIWGRAPDKLKDDINAGTLLALSPKVRTQACCWPIILPSMPNTGKRRPAT